MKSKITLVALLTFSFNFFTSSAFADKKDNNGTGQANDKGDNHASDKGNANGNGHGGNGGTVGGDVVTYPPNNGGTETGSDEGTIDEEIIIPDGDEAGTPLEVPAPVEGDTNAPIDGGLSVLIAAGVGVIAKKGRDRIKMEKAQAENEVL